MTQRRHYAVQVRSADPPAHIGRESAFDEDAACDPHEPGDELSLEQCDGCGACGFTVTDHRTVRCTGDEVDGEPRDGCGAEYAFVVLDEDAITW
jgi:hypothetical protein